MSISSGPTGVEVGPRGDGGGQSEPENNNLSTGSSSGSSEKVTDVTEGERLSRPTSTPRDGHDPLTLTEKYGTLEDDPPVGPGLGPGPRT